jgi:hypothetical protein
MTNMAPDLASRKDRAVEVVLQMPGLDQQLVYRAVQQLITESDPAYWLRRAEQFHAAAPRRSDFHGRATCQQLAEATQRCRETARACRGKTAFLGWEAGLPLIDPAGEREVEITQ